MIFLKSLLHSVFGDTNRMAVFQSEHWPEAYKLVSTALLMQKSVKFLLPNSLIYIWYLKEKKSLKEGQKEFGGNMHKTGKKYTLKYHSCLHTDERKYL